jgi:hypothetical protein
MLQDNTEGLGALRFGLNIKFNHVQERDGIDGLSPESSVMGLSFQPSPLLSALGGHFI